MTRTTMLVTIVTAALLSPQHADAQGTSPCLKSGFAFVSSQAILSSIPAYLQADTLVQKDYAAYQLEMAKLQGNLDSASRAYQDKSTLLSSAQKAAEIKKLEAQRDQIQAHGTDLQGKMQTRQAELITPITNRVQEVLDGMRAELNCSVIFDVSPGTGGSYVASADKSLDLTQRMIDRLKASEPKPAAKPSGGIKPPGGGGEEPDPMSPIDP
jgi:outer membrane protein